MHLGQSEWAIFDGRKNANLLPITKSKNYNAAITNADKDNIKTLRQWAENFFAENSSRPH